jgi:hypothetical protein
MIMAGTGVGGFLGKWFTQVNDRMVVKGIDHLDYHTPESLSGIWHTHQETSSMPNNLTTTVYHFGFSEEEGVIHTYAYRSYNNFRSETLPYGMAVKPECEVPEVYQLPSDVKRMMDSQRTIQASLPKNERIYIGGQIMIHHLTDQGYSIYPFTEFADYELNEQAMYENFEKVHRTAR